jgi:hypothetical protein
VCVPRVVNCVYSVKRDPVQCQKRPVPRVVNCVYSVKRDPVQCQKRPVPRVVNCVCTACSKATPSVQCTSSVFTLGVALGVALEEKKNTDHDCV